MRACKCVSAQVRSDLDTLLLPLLELLYSAHQRTANQMYMLLIILLMLSQDPAFAQNVHRVPLQVWGGRVCVGGEGRGAMRTPWRRGCGEGNIRSAGRGRVGRMSMGLREEHEAWGDEAGP